MDLKPCPFCGGDDIGHTGKHGVRFVCMSCECSGAFSHGDTEQNHVWDEAASVWNTRAADPAITAAVARAEALEAEVERLRGALTDIAEPTRLFSHGDPGVLRSHARAALSAARAPSRNIARLVGAVRYYADTFCEGFCKDLPRSDTYHDSMDDQCSGCKARAAIAALWGDANG